MDQKSKRRKGEKKQPVIATFMFFPLKLPEEEASMQLNLQEITGFIYAQVFCAVMWILMTLTTSCICYAVYDQTEELITSIYQCGSVESKLRF